VPIIQDCNDAYSSKASRAMQEAAPIADSVFRYFLLSVLSRRAEVFASV